MSKKHRGRIQAQGGDTEKSVSWSQDEPLSKVDGLKLLNDLQNQLTERERQEREKQLANDQRFIENVQGGIDAPERRSFYGAKGKSDGIRIDIEVWRGIAFLSLLIAILLFLFGFK